MPTALIVEDEPEANELLALLVQLRGYSAVSAYSGIEALEKIEHGLPDIVFLDLMLPDINGYEVCRRLKSLKRTSLIPVVMVTARIAADNRQQSFCIGADDYVPKPYTPDQIFQAMDEADAWLKDIERDGHGRKGVVVFRLESDQAMRQLAQLRNLLVARTPLEVECVCKIGDALEALRESAERWGRRCNRDPESSLVYQIEPDRVVFALEGGSDWFAQTRHSPTETWPIALAAAGFDELEYGTGERRLRFTRRFAPA